MNAQPEGTAYEGKAKRLRRRGADVEVFFKDDATAFNAARRASFAGKGAACCGITALLLAEVERAGIAQHLRAQLAEHTLLCRHAEMIALEVVLRFRVAGSLQRRTGLPDGTPCAVPVIEFYYKNDALGDPLVNFDHIQMLRLASAAEVAQLSALGLRVATLVRDFVALARLELVDIKLEFGRCDGALVLADEISPDTCRLHDRDDGRVLDKDLFRRGDGDLVAAYREVLARLRGIGAAAGRHV